MQQAQLFLEDIPKWQEELKDNPGHPPLIDSYQMHFHKIACERSITAAETLAEKASNCYQPGESFLDSAMKLVDCYHLPSVINEEGKPISIQAAMEQLNHLMCEKLEKLDELESLSPKDVESFTIAPAKENTRIREHIITLMEMVTDLNEHRAECEYEMMRMTNPKEQELLSCYEAWSKFYQEAHKASTEKGASSFKIKQKGK